MRFGVLSTGAAPGATRRTTTRPSPTTTRPSGSIRSIALAYNNRGIAWRDKKEYDKAIADYNEAIRLDPKLRRVTTTGATPGLKKEYDKAIADYNEAIRLDPKFGFVTTTGACLERKKEFDKAIADFTEAIRLDPKSHSPQQSG